MPPLGSKVPAFHCHIIGVEAKTELCATVSNTLSLCFFRYKGLTACPFRRTDLAVDLRQSLVKGSALLLRKEVIQPQVPLRLPCYDFIPVTTHTLGGCLLAVGAPTSGTSDFHDVTGGVYKARERIHGVVADTPLLAIPAS